MRAARRAALVAACLALAGCPPPCNPGSITETVAPGVYSGTVSFESSPSFPVAAAVGPVEVIVDRSAGTVRVGYFDRDGARVVETWRITRVNRR